MELYFTDALKIYDRWSLPTTSNAKWTMKMFFSIIRGEKYLFANHSRELILVLCGINIVTSTCLIWGIDDLNLSQPLLILWWLTGEYGKMSMMSRGTYWKSSMCIRSFSRVGPVSPGPLLWIHSPNPPTSRGVPAAPLRCPRPETAVGAFHERLPTVSVWRPGNVATSPVWFIALPHAPIAGRTHVGLGWGWGACTCLMSLCPRLCGFF